MTTHLARNRVRVLRAIGTPPDSLAWRRWVERALAHSDLRPRGVRPQATVCVRQLRLASPPRNRVAWLATLDRRLDEMRGAAARPFREAVPANAMMVVFDDEAELLACAARDCRCSANAWWWNSLFDEALSDAVVRRAYVSSAMFAPAAFELLAECGLAVDVVRTWPAAACVEVEAAIAHAFGIPAAPATTQSLHAPDTHLARPSNRARPERLLDPYVVLGARVFSQLSADRALAPEQRSLLVAAALARRAPALARRPGVVGTLCGVLTSSLTHGDDDDVALTVSTDQQRPGVLRGKQQNAGDERRAIPDASSAIAASAGDPQRGRADRPSDHASSAAEIVAAGRTAIASIGHDAPDAVPPAVEIFDSDYAGIVYVINLAIHLGLYGDFTQPDESGGPMPLGCFLARVGERACGHSLQDDEIWRLLAVFGADQDEALDKASAARWIDDVTPRLERTAAIALDLREGSGLPFLCARRGRVELGRTRVEVVFALAEHPVTIRRAGIDRDPGWVPAAGRVVAFNYE